LLHPSGTTLPVIEHLLEDTLQKGSSRLRFIEPEPNLAQSLCLPDSLITFCDSHVEEAFCVMDLWFLQRDMRKHHCPSCSHRVLLGGLRSKSNSNIVRKTNPTKVSPKYFTVGKLAAEVKDDKGGDDIFAVLSWRIIFQQKRNLV